MTIWYTEGKKKEMWHFGIFGCEIVKVKIYAISYGKSHVACLALLVVRQLSYLTSKT